MSRSIEHLLQRLKQWFTNHKGTITAFSGGVDSALVLYLSHRFLGKNGVGCISVSPSLKKKDYAEAIEFCENFNIPLEIIETQEAQDENYLANPSNRCYFCKSHLYRDLHKLKEKYPSFALLNGTNYDDLGDYRPGLQAADENGIKSPLADCQITKEEVRRLARHFELPNWNKPASPCLSSRVPYGHFITTFKLKQIEEAESILNDWGFVEVRVRHHGDEARIEVPLDQLQDIRTRMSEISERFQKIGFTRCVLDEEGLVSGKLNRALNLH